MNSKLSPLVLSLVAGLLLAPLGRAEEDPLNDPDLQDALKQAQEIQKQSGPAKPAKMADLQKQAAEIQAQQEKEEAEQKQKEQAALQKQLAEPGPTALPDWTPATPGFKATSALTKKIVDDQVRVIQTGTSSLSPEEIMKAWEAAVADKPLNHFYNRGTSNGNVTNRLDVSTRTDPVQKVRLEARRGVGEKITQVTISLELPKPYED
jgi:hypothetical protein